MRLLAKSRKLFHYLVGKRSELNDLDIKDIVMAKTILDIHRKRTHKVVVSVPLFSLHQIHILDRESAILATRKRIEALEANKKYLLDGYDPSIEEVASFVLQAFADSFGEPAAEQGGTPDSAVVPDLRRWCAGRDMALEY